MTALIDYSYDECLNMHYNLPMSDICNYGGNPALVDELQTAFASLNENNSFTHFDFHPSIEERTALESLVIDSTAIEGKGSCADYTPNCPYPYSNSYDLENLSSGLKLYIESLSAENEDISAVIANFITNTVSSVINSVGSDSAEIAIRASIPNNKLSNLEWHTDGCQSVYDYQIVIALKGASTLFYDTSDDLRDDYVSAKEDFQIRHSNLYQNVGLEAAGEASSLHNLNVSRMFDFSKASSSTKLGYGSSFLCGSEKNEAMHISPSIYEDRLFMIISPGKMTY